MTVNRAAQHYSVDISSRRQFNELQRLEQTHGQKVHDWLAEGMPREAMGNPREMRAFRMDKARSEHQASEPQHEQSVQRMGGCFSQPTEDIDEPSEKSSIGEQGRQVLSIIGFRTRQLFRQNVLHLKILTEEIRAIVEKNTDTKIRESAQQQNNADRQRIAQLKSWYDDHWAQGQRTKFQILSLEKRLERFSQHPGLKNQSTQSLKQWLRLVRILREERVKSVEIAKEMCDISKKIQELRDRTSPSRTEDRIRQAHAEANQKISQLKQTRQSITESNQDIIHQLSKIDQSLFNRDTVNYEQLNQELIVRKELDRDTTNQPPAENPFAAVIPQLEDALPNNIA
jgi:hypothetical protein